MLKLANKKTSDSKTPNRLGNSLKEKLLTSSKEELVELLLDFTKSYENINDDLRLIYASNDEISEISLGIVKRYINEAKVHDEIPYENIEHALIGAKQAIETVSVLNNNKNYKFSVELIILLLGQLVPMLEISNDKDNAISYLIDVFIHLLSDTVLRCAGDSENSTDVNEKKQIYTIMKNEATKPYCYKWVDWRCSILDACIPLCTDEEIRVSLTGVITDLLEEGKENKWHRQLVEPELKKLIFRIKYIYEDKEEAYRYAENNIGHTYFRKIAMENAVEEKHFEKIIYWLNKGIDYIGDIDKSEQKEYLYLAYKGLEDKENQRRLAEEFILDGDIRYYSDFKKLSGEKDWNDTLEVILDILNSDERYSDAYIYLIMKEKKYNKLLEAAVNKPDIMLEHYKKLMEVYPAETKDGLIKQLNKMSTNIKNKDDYEKVTQTILAIDDAIGSYISGEILNNFKETYKKNIEFYNLLMKVENEINSKKS